MPLDEDSSHISEDDFYDALRFSVSVYDCYDYDCYDCYMTRCFVVQIGLDNMMLMFVAKSVVIESEKINRIIAFWKLR